ncbi:His/Gly/Thr/Pro-type tRNA ligase C-terminal domain-containing protein [Streptomyces sp. RB6PN25]|uniref:His/Gly/Thr/Pro-type tRNA ligase C-terminal domain-containing protein n=1 Tax=Streptomyces humicola TaxID=2953240 RepID=A0ABT1PPL4_9ACTN|nr:His/Gly/Thr/Pro-type tRNA ligase C-terminal domain-containing protein [Streptomyces humicola]MCQ4079620.1 His/Gly/Thr/Pro-type tRNA ligase C-terminal domain-containing protein [Streptomyces humicola]
MRVVDVRVLDDSGSVVWSGPEEEYPVVAATLDPGNSALRMSAGEAGTGDGGADGSVTRCRRNDVMTTAETLGLVSRRGVPRGFLTTLPHGAVFEAGVEAFNNEHLAALDVNAVHFPLVFDNSAPATAELTAQYAAQNRMFALAGHDDRLRLAYAADPNLFAWLADSVLDTARLPYAMYSPQPVFRNFRSGEVNIQRRLQFTVPDVHIWTRPADAAEQYLHALALAAESTSFWFGGDYLHVLDSVAGTPHDDDGFYRQVAKAARGLTVVRRLSAHPKYYAQKTAILVSAGYDNVMLHNLQLDEVNAERFNIRTDDGGHPVVIHACVAMGGSRMLPLVIGRGLAGLTPQLLPPELAAIQLQFLPLHERHTDRANALAEPLREQGVRTAVDCDFHRSTGARIARLRRAWQPLVCVVGDRELTDAPRIQTSAGRSVHTDYHAFLADRMPRWQRCRPATPNRAAAPPVVKTLRPRNRGAR